VIQKLTIQTPPAQPIPNVSSASVCPLVVTVIHWLMIQMAFVLQMKFARTVHASPPFPQDVNVTQQLMIQMLPAHLTLSVSSASVFPLDVTVILILMTQMAFVLQMKFARTVHASPPFPQDVNVTQQLMIQMLPAHLTLSVSSASVCPRVVIVILMLQIQTASVHLETFARTAHASHHFPQAVTVTQQLMIQTPHVLQTPSVSSASVCPRDVTVIHLLMIQTASALLETFARTANAKLHFHPAAIVILTPMILTISVPLT